MPLALVRDDVPPLACMHRARRIDRPPPPPRARPRSAPSDPLLRLPEMVSALLVSALLRQHTADLVAVFPAALPIGGGGMLALIGDRHGGLLAGSQWAGHDTPPPNFTLCCDYNGLSTAIGGDTVATMTSPTNGSCPIPPFAATGDATVELYLTTIGICNGSDCHLGGSPRHCDHGLTGKPSIEVLDPASMLSFAPGRRPYVHEASGALVVRAAPLAEMAPWLPPGGGPVRLQITATIDLPSGPRQLFPTPHTIAPGQITALPFNFAGWPSRVDAMVTCVVSVLSTGATVLTTNSSRLLQRFVPQDASETPGNLVQLDRHRRALLVDGEIFQGNGWYV
eukprot:COSAG05_NODE_5008_length_1293_cov_0.938861_1_plen_337_part_10